MNWLHHRWLVAGILSIALGYGVLALRQSETLGPILLVGGYCVLIPMHLWARYRRGMGE